MSACGSQEVWNKAWEVPFSAFVYLESYPAHADDIKLEGFQRSGIEELDYLCLSGPMSGIKDNSIPSSLRLPDRQTSHSLDVPFPRLPSFIFRTLCIRGKDLLESSWSSLLPWTQPIEG